MVVRQTWGDSWGASFDWVPTAPSQQGTHALGDSMAKSPSGEFHAVAEWICIWSPWLGDYPVDSAHTGNLQPVSVDLLCISNSSIYSLAWCKYSQSPVDRIYTQSVAIWPLLFGNFMGKSKNINCSSDLYIIRVNINVVDPEIQVHSRDGPDTQICLRCKCCLLIPLSQ